MRRGVYIRGMAVVLAALPTLSGVAEATTIRVPSEQPNIQAGIDASVTGDTVLVHPGTYQEALTWANKDLTLLGDGLAPPIIITGSSTSTVMSVGPGVTRHSAIENLTIRDGCAEEGAGIKLVASSPAVKNCRFEANFAEVPYQGTGPSRGGALFVSADSNPVLTDCSFIQNESNGSFPVVIWWGEGGAIFVESGGSLEVRRCRFEENVAFGAPEGGFGGAIRLSGLSSAIIDSCAFEGNFAFGGGVASDWQVAVSNCVFQDNFGYSGAAVSAGGTCTIENSQFLSNESFGFEHGVIHVIGTGQITNNTIAFNEGSWTAGLSAPAATVANNIICENLGWGMECYNPQLFFCNDVWGNTRGGEPANYYGCDLTGMNGNISQDPLFCNAEAGDFTLDALSPCAPENSAGCGLIGAWPVGCGTTAVGPVAVLPAGRRLTIRPNPILTTAEFVLDREQSATLEIYDPVGRLVEKLGVSGSATWTPGRSLRSGVYFARLRDAGDSQVVRFIVLR